VSGGAWKEKKTMNEMDSISKKNERTSLSRRNLFRGAVGAVAGANLFRPKPTFADNNHDRTDHLGCALVNPIPGGGAPFKPFGVVVHHNPLSPATPLANISDPSQITDFDGFVGLTHIQGGGTGTDTISGATTPLAFRADMGFARGRFIGIDGQPLRGTFVFV
jgi:hypothetical protein